MNNLLWLKFHICDKQATNNSVLYIIVANGKAQWTAGRFCRQIYRTVCGKHIGKNIHDKPILFSDLLVCFGLTSIEKRCTKMSTGEFWLQVNMSLSWIR